MKLSPAAELAIRGALVLAEDQAQGPVTLAKICQRRQLPKQYLTKIFGALARAGLITPIRGKKGGYQLGREPRDITILEIIEAVEGPVALNFCQHSPPRCDQPNCPLRAVWGDLQKTVRRKLGGITLADCLD
jgi:Rrf2 family cysteine metabolism transcriptional repressor